MAKPALRAFAAAGVISLGLLIGGFTAAPVLAQPSDSDGSSQSGSTDTGTSSGTTGSGSDSTASSKPDTPTGSSDPDSSAQTPDDTDSPSVSVDTSVDEETRSGGSGGSTEPDVAPPTKAPQRTSNSITLPMLRLPAPGEIPFGKLPAPSTFYTTVQIPVPTLTEFLSALQILPPPPPPGPSFRTQEEAPVVDAGTGTAVGGGSGAGADPTVFRAPLVVTVPRAITVAGAGPKPAVRAPGGVPAEPGFTAPGVAGANTPVIRGSVAPTPGTTARPMAREGAPRPEGMRRAVLNPTLAQIAAVALPGVAGLALLTFGGGVIGYRQANSVRFVRTAGAERFLP
ncbi:hypothetical protein BST22_17535 [Mycolicibacterium chubuense]|uniref:IgA FC receptor n=1 Tax=Mycolicibacterium chubuense TaxID=1800 RepID=A0A0J6YJW5_MYCCU|nr:hypothetical protein [Mycolicibacterium chubuense]KMO73106.1 hypothetical protein MCHUDSM44219_04283 [Mycolicibacterium chubuense]ORA49340.1 hypothetical protein BST22_17535 [Mycolicibacterium chubuense]SPX98643.1 Uncharacterised protein [Mycolicibacterium chubuense]